VLVRQVHREDVPLLRDGFLRLSTESRRLRFLTDKTHLTEAELRYFTEIDHHDHEAIGALDEETGRGLGIARYIRSAEEPTEAEVAVTVVDDWQHRGLGTELLRRLNARAREEGVLTFTALVDVENEAVVGLMRNLGAEVSVTRYEHGAADYRITPQPTDARALQDVLRQFARREVAPPGSSGTPCTPSCRHGSTSGRGDPHSSTGRHSRSRTRTRARLGDQPTPAARGRSRCSSSGAQRLALIRAGVGGRRS
jgi:RimJ/RimL family protein N-acetyltransferase